jgi:hypothetical protein
MFEGSMRDTYDSDDHNNSASNTQLPAMMVGAY